jgi:hypothetical protein
MSRLLIRFFTVSWKNEDVRQWSRNNTGEEKA